MATDMMSIFKTTRQPAASCNTVWHGPQMSHDTNPEDQMASVGFGSQRHSRRGAVDILVTSGTTESSMVQFSRDRRTAYWSQALLQAAPTLASAAWARLGMPAVA